MTLASLIETVEDLKKLEAELGKARSIYNLGPIKSLLSNPAFFDVERIQSSSIDLRLAVVGLESGKLRFVSKDGRIEGLNESSVNLVDAVLASAAIPFVFPPVKLGSETYVDGGVREMVPIQAAVTAGADRIFALVASKAGIGPMGSFDHSNISDITKRAAADIMPDEIQRNETHPDGLGWPSTVTVIQPRIDLHDGLTIHPGLISLAIDYGWMCASDAVGETADLPLRAQVTDHLSLLRKQIVEREEGALSRAGTWFHFRGMKRRLAQLVSLRLAAGGPIPTGTNWWQRWEGHRRAWTRPTVSPWDLYQLRPYPEPEYVSAEQPPSVASAPTLATATYGSTIVLGHWLTGAGLYSDTRTYRHTGTSGQQRILALDESDGNDYWHIKGPHSQPPGYRWGEPVRDGDVIRLEHVGSRRNLHSHAGIPSPATGQQEVTCFGEQGSGDANDDWRVQIEGGGTWVAGKRIRLIHVPTNHALHSHLHFYIHEDVYEEAGALTSLQEVTAFSSRDDNDRWFMIQATPRPIRSAAFVRQSVPSTLETGQGTRVAVTMRNTGSATWTTGGTTPCRLGSQNPQDNRTWGLARVELPVATVPPGAEVTFSFDVRAPATPGTYNFQWRMVHELVEWFGDFTPSVAIQVVSPPPPRSAAFVRQSVPSTMEAGLRETVVVTMRNTGSATWTTGGTTPCRLGSQNPQDNRRWELARVGLPVATVPPGTEVTFSFDVRAPATPGTYNFQWRMVQELVEWFGDFTPNVRIHVHEVR